MANNGKRAAAVVAAATLALGASIGAATAAPPSTNKNASSPGTAMCEGFDRPLQVTFNRSEKTPVAFFEGGIVALAREVEGTFTLTIQQGTTTLFTSTETFEETVAGGVRRGMRITECTFDFLETEEVVLDAALIEEINSFGGNLDPALEGETVTFVYASEGTVLAQLVGRRPGPGRGRAGS